MSTKKRETEETANAESPKRQKFCDDEKKGTTEKKIALITGITGQDGSYLTELLLEKGYEVHGIIRRSSSFNTGRIDHLYRDRHDTGVKLFLHYGDLCDSCNLASILEKVQPSEIYNLGAQSHVQVSFEMGEYTGNVDGLGVLRLLDAMRTTNIAKKCRFYQASTSELYGKVRETPQTEDTPFYPRSPYAVAKQYAFWICVNYREAYGMHVSNGILFNHESPRRGGTFVTRKVTRAAVRIKLGTQTCLFLGNLDSKRDWGHAKDYVRAMWMMLQADTPSDYVCATGETQTVRTLVELAFKHVDIVIKWEGEGVKEVGKNSATNQIIVKIDPRYFRPTEVDLLLGDASKIKEKLGWQPTVTFKELVAEMVEHDMKEAAIEKKKVDLNLL